MHTQLLQQSQLSFPVPLLYVSRELNHAPYITYSDHALHNWCHKDSCVQDSLLTNRNLQSHLIFTGLPEEDGIYMIDIRMELKSAEAVELLRLSTRVVKLVFGFSFFVTKNEIRFLFFLCKKTNFFFYM